MDVQTGFFYLFSAILLFAAFRVITARNPVHAVLHLMLAFSQAAALWLLLRAEFLAIVLVLVYLGAVMVLFLFVVMMLDINLDTIRRNFWKHFPLAALIGALIALEMAGVVLGGYRLTVEPAGLAGVPTATEGAAAIAYSNSQLLGTLLYTQYLYPLEIAAVILLVAMIAAIALTLRERKDTKQIDPSLQVRVKPRDRLRIVQLQPTRLAVEPVAVASEAAAVLEEKKA